MAAAPTETVRVLLAEDHPLYRAALSELIDAAPDLDLVAAVADGETAFAAIVELHPQVAVLDMRMPRLPGDRLMSRLAQVDFAPRVLFVSEYAEGDMVLNALIDGAAGYLHKSAGESEIIAAIHRVAAGDTVLPAELAADLADALRSRGVGGPKLTEREVSILTMLTEGTSAIEIASTLHLAVSTVRGHIHDLYRKLGVTERAAAVAVAIRRGLVR